MMTMYDRMIRDMPQQFHEKHNIDILIKAFARQFEEVEQMLKDVNELTTLDNAKGVNLDNVGDIVCLSRKDARTVLKDTTAKKIKDDVYRKAIQWKTLKNTCDCTYDDIMTSLNLIWNTDNITYFEDPNVPATVFILLPSVGFDEVDPSVGRVLAIKSSGVAIVYSVDYVEKINISGLERFIVRVMFRMSFEYPIPEEPISLRVPHKTTMRYGEKFPVSVTHKKYLWFLDGSYMMDGSKTLNAILKKEEL